MLFLSRILKIKVFTGFALSLINRPRRPTKKKKSGSDIIHRDGGIMLHPHELASFFSLCSVIVLQSSNKPGLTARTYNFGL